VNRPQRKHFHETDRKENTAAPLLPWDRPQRKRWSLLLLRGCWLLGNVLPLLTVVSQCARHNILVKFLKLPDNLLSRIESPQSSQFRSRNKSRPVYLWRLCREGRTQNRRSLKITTFAAAASSTYSPLSILNSPKFRLQCWFGLNNSLQNNVINICCQHSYDLLPTMLRRCKSGLDSKHSCYWYVTPSKHSCYWYATPFSWRSKVSVNCLFACQITTMLGWLISDSTIWSLSSSQNM
jgi:hypothetical protein